MAAAEEEEEEGDRRLEERVGWELRLRGGAGAGARATVSPSPLPYSLALFVCRMSEWLSPRPTAVRDRKRLGEAQSLHRRRRCSWASAVRSAAEGTNERAGGRASERIVVVVFVVVCGRGIRWQKRGEARRQRTRRAASRHCESATARNTGTDKDERKARLRGANYGRSEGRPDGVDGAGGDRAGGTAYGRVAPMIRTFLLQHSLARYGSRK